MGTVSDTNAQNLALNPPVKSEFQDQSASWKSTLTFTGNNVAFPVEMFIALIDQTTPHSNERKNEDEKEKRVAQYALSHIPDLDSEQNSVFPASVWKHDNLERLKKLNWQDLKDELLCEFGLKREYNLNEKLELLFSIEKGEEETRDNFLLRISMIVCCIEQGKICSDEEDQGIPPPPSEVWIEILCTAGILSSARNTQFLFKEYSALQESSSSHIKNSQDTNSNGGTSLSSSSLVNRPHSQAETNFHMYTSLPNYNVPSKDMKLETQSYQDFISRSVEQNINTMNKTSIEISSELEPSFLIHGDEEINEDELSQIQSTEKPSQSKLKKYSCRVCGKMFRFKRNEIHHRFQEHNKDNQCYICNLFYKSISDRKQHKLKFHKNGKLCEICDVEFEGSNEVENHQIEQHEGRQFRCKLCSSEMMYDAINQHFQNVHYQGRTKRIRVFKNKRRRFVSSLSKVPEGKDPRLHTDSTDSPLKYVLPGGNTHLKGKVNHVVVFCGVCNKEMKNSKDLVEHRIQEHDGMKFRCDVCDYLCKRPAELARHRLSRHLLETEGFKSLACPYDDCDFKCLEVSKDMLQKHIDGVHKKLKQNRCGVCDKMFSSKGTLKFHMGHVHMGLKKNMCELCPKGYLNQRNLDHHKIIAHGIGELVKHVCYICGKDVTSKTNLTKHISWVHGIFKKKEYKKVTVDCPHCNKSINKACLKLHIKRMHQEHKPFPCQQCGRGFASGGELNTHNKKVHLKVRPFRCRICGKTYPQGDDLKFHIGTLHEGMSMEEAKKQRFSLGPNHPAFERLTNRELDQIQVINDKTRRDIQQDSTHPNVVNEEERKPIL